MKVYLLWPPYTNEFLRCRAEQHEKFDFAQGNTILTFKSLTIIEFNGNALIKEGSGHRELKTVSECNTRPISKFNFFIANAAGPCMGRWL